MHLPRHTSPHFRLRPLPALALGLIALGACRAPVEEAVVDPEVAPRAEVGQGGLELSGCEVELSLDPEAAAIAATARLQLTARAARVEWISLRLEGLTVSSVVGAAGDLAFSQQGGELAVMLPAPLLAGEGTEFTVTYGGSPQLGLHFVRGAELGEVYAYTDGRPGTLRHWLPTLGDPFTGRSPAQLAVRVPQGWTVVSGGLAAAPEDAGEGATRFAFQSTGTVAQLGFVAGPLVRESSAAPHGVVHVYGSALRREELARAAAEAARAHTFVQALLGTWRGGGPAADAAPPALQLVHAPEAVRPAGGSTDLGALADLRLTTVSAAAIERTVAAALPAASAADQWVAAGVAEFGLALYARELGGEEPYQEVLERAAERVAQRRPAGAAGRLQAAEGEDPSAVLEDGWRAARGAQLLNLVRGALGPEALLRGLQALAERGAEGPVGSLDLAQCLTAAHGQPLPIVWEQWTTAPGSPTFDVSWTHDERAGEVVLRVRQVQDGESGTPRAYRLPVEVELAVGPRTEVHRLELGQRSESLRLKVASRPRWVRFDRAGWIPGTVLEQKSVDEWFAIVADRGDPRGRVRALEALLGRALAEREADRSLYLTQFGGRLERDESPRVRRAAALGLGQLGGEAAVRWLARSAEQDTEWRVRAAALEGLRAHARTSLVDLAALAERRLERDPEVAAEALALRAAADPVTASSYLRSTWARRAETPVRVAVVQVLAQVEQARSEPWLREVAADGLLPVAVRAAALEALGLRERAAPETVELLGQLLGSEAGAVREAALESLGRLDGEDARRLLEAHAAQTAEPAERRAIEAALARRR